MSDPIRVSLPGGRVMTIECDDDQARTVNDVLEEQGVDPSSVSLMVNGEATTLDRVLSGGELVVATSDGKGARV